MVGMDPDMEEMVSRIIRQCEYQTLYVEADVFMVSEEDHNSATRRVVFGRSGDDFRIDFIDNAPDQSRFPKPQMPPGLESIAPKFERGDVARFTETLYNVGGKLQKRLKIEYEGTTQTSESPYEDAAVGFFGHQFWPMPDMLLGSFGPYARIMNKGPQGLRMKKFLETPGPFRLTKRGEYQVLSHAVKIACDVCSKPEKELSVDIYLDGHSNIVRMVELVRLWDVGDETIRTVCGNEWFDVCGRIVSLECSDFKNINGVVFPKKATVTHFSITDETRKKLNRADRTGDLIDRINAFCGDAKERIGAIYTIDVKVCRINEPLPPGFLDMSVPVGTWVYTDGDTARKVEKDIRPWYVRWRFAVLLAACCVITLAIGWAGVRWLGWRSG